MESPRESFSGSGVPQHLIGCVNWNDGDYRRCVAACLVEGVYIQEHDRQKNSQGTPQALAPPWWESFGFKLIEQLEDVNDHSIFGAIYEIVSSHYLDEAPKRVIAFRGTLFKRDTWRQDLKLDFEIFFNRLQESSRFGLAMEIVRNMAAEYGAANIWLAGHSLGSAMALLVGKNMFKNMGYAIETYLFNSPSISSFPIEQRLENDKAKNALRSAKGFLKTGVTFTLKGHQQRREDRKNFVALSEWVPNLFVNPYDPICSGYIGHFQKRKSMGKLRTRISISGTLESELLLPSAFLTQNMNPSKNFIPDHGIQQWWSPELSSHSERHIFKFK
ncbi:GDSL esterase/lipase At4g10955-like isoform X2 [Cornus florida]|uniref:GDSL esterase/lipase At4g10955-like isoform X2 n=1 Tax=Cornus florida TaxID=4283 RepID=UPI0028A14521|nr:GDSL esterase/lipase At4g10955-like isoform X2 [Cornus florida]